MKNKKLIPGDKTTGKREYHLIYWLLAVFPLIVTLLVFPSAPDVVPAHYGLNNEVNRWGSKYELFLFPAITLLLAPLFRGLVPLRMGKNSAPQSESSQASSQKASMRVCYASLVLFNLMNGMMLYTSLNKVTNLSGIGYERIIAVVISVIQIVIGNVLPKCKQNYVIGIRVPWTLASETVWYQTHRFAGKLDVLAGIVCLILSFVLPQKAALWAALGILLAAAAVEVIYSYLAFVKQKTDQTK